MKSARDIEREPTAIPREFTWGKICRTSGFSLVEVTLAMGIVGFALLAILGLFPVGLATLRESINETVETQIVQGIAARSLVANFTNLAGTSYFDDEGQPMSQANARYTVMVTSTNAPVFPGSASTFDIGDSLATLQIEIASRQHTNLYSLKVANSGK